MREDEWVHVDMWVDVCVSLCQVLTGRNVCIVRIWLDACAQVQYKQYDTNKVGWAG